MLIYKHQFHRSLKTVKEVGCFYFISTSLPLHFSEWMEIFISFVLNERVKSKSFVGYPSISLTVWMRKCCLWKECINALYRNKNWPIGVMSCSFCGSLRSEMEAVLFVIESIWHSSLISWEKKRQIFLATEQNLYTRVYYSICYFLENYSYFFSVRQFIYFLIC